MRCVVPLELCVFLELWVLLGSLVLHEVWVLLEVSLGQQDTGGTGCPRSAPSPRFLMKFPHQGGDSGVLGATPSRAEGHSW